MTILNFEVIPPEDIDKLKPLFLEYLNEIDKYLSTPLDYSLEDRYPQFDEFFKEDGHRPKTPFYIVKEAIQGDDIREKGNKQVVGLLFLTIMTPEDFPENIPSLYPSNVDRIAWMTDFYIYPEYRQRGYAWKFYDALIQWLTDPINPHHIAWECNVNNEPAVNFYYKVLKRIQSQHPYNMVKHRYRKKVEGEHSEYFFYQVMFKYDEE